VDGIILVETVPGMIPGSHCRSTIGYCRPTLLPGRAYYTKPSKEPIGKIVTDVMSVQLNFVSCFV